MPSFEQYQEHVANAQKEMNRTHFFKYFFFWLGVCTFWGVVAFGSAFIIQFCVASMSFGVQITLKDVFLCYIVAILIGYLHKLFPVQ
jgi:tetrahydromethanopterin S-methyltransferase subunit E